MTLNPQGRRDVLPGKTSRETDIVLSGSVFDPTPVLPVSFRVRFLRMTVNLFSRGLSWTDTLPLLVIFSRRRQSQQREMKEPGLAAPVFLVLL